MTMQQTKGGEMSEELLTVDVDEVAGRSYVELLILASRLGIRTNGLDADEIIQEAKMAQAQLRGD